MPDFFSIKHSFKGGDLICILPGLQKIYKERGIRWRIYQRIGMPEFINEQTKQYTTDMVCMDRMLFDNLKPLIESQEYIESFEVWEGQPVDIDTDLSRDSNSVPFPAGEIHHWTWATAPELACDLSVPWLKVNPMTYCNTNKGVRQLSETLIFNRTERYINPYITYYFLKQYEGNIVFSGSESEHKAICESWNIDVPLLLTEDFLELARVISSCKLFVGNASLNFHIADAIKTNRVIELSRIFPNTFPTGANGYGFYSQKAAEFYVQKLMQ